MVLAGSGRPKDQAPLLRAQVQVLQALVEALIRNKAKAKHGSITTCLILILRDITEHSNHMSRDGGVEGEMVSLTTIPRAPTSFSDFCSLGVLSAWPVYRYGHTTQGWVRPNPRIRRPMDSGRAQPCPLFSKMWNSYSLPWSRMKEINMCLLRRLTARVFLGLSARLASGDPVHTKAALIPTHSPRP